MGELPTVGVEQPEVAIELRRLSERACIHVEDDRARCSDIDSIEVDIGPLVAAVANERRDPRLSVDESECRSGGDRVVGLKRCWRRRLEHPPGVGGIGRQRLTVEVGDKTALCGEQQFVGARVCGA